MIVGSGGAAAGAVEALTAVGARVRIVARRKRAALAHELTMLRREVLDRIALEVGPDVVTDLRTRVGG